MAKFDEYLAKSFKALKNTSSADFDQTAQKELNALFAADHFGDDVAQKAIDAEKRKRAREAKVMPVFED